MSKIRVHELAKELNRSSRDIIYALKGHGIDVEGHLSSLSTDQAEKMRKHFAGSPVKSEQQGEKKAAPVKSDDAVTTTQSQPVQSQQSNGQEQRQGGYNNQNRQGGYNNQNRQGGYNNQNRQGGYQNRQNGEGGQRPGGYNNQNRQGGYQNRQNGEGGQRPGGYNNQNRQGGYQNRQNGEGGQRPGGYNNQNRQGGYQNRQNGEGGQRPGGYNNQNRQGGYQNRQNGEGGQRPGGYNNQNRPGGYQNRQNGEGGQRPGGYNNQNRQGGGYNNQNRQGGGYNNQNRQGGGYNNQNRQGGGYNNQNRQGGQGRPYNNNGRPDQKERGFGMDSGITKEVVMTKDTTRENRRNYKDNKDSKERINKTVIDGRGGKKGGKNVTMKKTLQPPTQKPAPVVEKITSITIPETLTIKELADKMKMPAATIVKKLFLEGKMVNMNSDITYEEAEEIALEYEILCEHEVVIDVIEEMLKEDEEDEKDLKARPPVVCVMGHVDHGKTSILDAIRKTKVTSGEAGGITQHIGAYVVDVDGQKITFLDTPGHEAFTSMRLRGAQSTDIAILVVAADDGVMPQTIEAINHAKAAGVEVIVAINKIDKPSANIERVKQELTEYELIPEDWGGQTICVPVSAHSGEGLDDLLESIILVSEVLELKANPDRNGRGLVLEAQLDKGRGPVATVLVQKGTLCVGDTLAVGTAFGKVRAMIDDKGRRVKKATPSTPVEILGLNDVPQAGEVFIATNSEKEARSMAETFIATNREKMLKDTKAKLSLDSLITQIKAGQIKELNIIVKADVQGSVEAVKQSLLKLSNEEVAVKIIHGGVGAINESDVILASASNAIVIGFNVRPDSAAKQTAETEKVDVRLYRVIYNAIEDVEAALKGMLDPTFEEKVIGHAEVRQTYKVSGVGTIIGAYVLDGYFERHCKVRLLRDNVVMYDGDLASLKRFKDDVKEVKTGYECGMAFEKYNDIKEGDQIEAYIMAEVPR